MGRCCPSVCALGLISLLFACSEDQPASSSVPVKQAGEHIDPNGILRLPTNLAVDGGLSLDPIDPKGGGDYWLHYLIYDTLLREQEDGSYQPGLARSATISDPNTIEIELFDGITFHDGTPLTATSVKRSIERNVREASAAGHRRQELDMVEAVTVLGPTTLEVRLGTPTAGSFYNLLAHNETLVVSTQALETGVDLRSHPVGAGPFRVVRYDAETRIVLEKYADYFQADDIRLAGVEIIQVAGPAATINALRAGNVDAAPANYEMRSQVRGTNLATRTSLADAVIFFSMQCARGHPALADVRVRRALNYAIDNEAINNIVFGGNAEPMTQFFSSRNRFYNPQLAGTYRHDPVRARELLAEAGIPHLRLTAGVPPTGGYLVTISEIVQQSWADVGVELELIPTNDGISDFFITAQMDLYPGQTARSGVDKVMRAFLPTSLTATCVPQEPEFAEAIAELRKLYPGDSAARPLWHEVNRILNHGAYGGFLTTATVDNIWDPSRIGNPRWRRNVFGQAHPDVWKVYIRKP